MTFLDLIIKESLLTVEVGHEIDQMECNESIALILS